MRTRGVSVLDRLSVREVRALVTLKHKPGMSLIEIARQLEIPPSSAHGMMTKLVAMGLVKRENNLYYITDKGEAAIAELRELLAAEVV